MFVQSQGLQGQEVDQTKESTKTETLQEDAQNEAADEKPKLTIGSKAPSLDIEHWISNGKGKFAEVKEFQKDRIYVVEFWATWCPPCVASIPHLSELQEKYADKNIQIISITDEDLETVKKFLEKEVPRKETSFAELTQTYSLASDPDSSVHDDYLEASGESGIPTAFVVGKTGLIEWIGHPMELDSPLQQIVDGTWDREAFAEQRKMAGEDLEQRFQEFLDLFTEASELAETGEVEEALALLNKAIEEESNDQWKKILGNAKLQFTIAYVGGEQARDAFQNLVKAAGEDAEEIGALVLLVCDIHDEKPQEEEFLKLVRKTAEEVAETNDDQIEIQYGLGRIRLIQKDYVKSLAALEKAVKLIESFEPTFEQEQAWIEAIEEELIDWIAKVKDLIKNG